MMPENSWTNCETECVRSWLIKDPATHYNWIATGRDIYLKAQPDEKSSKREIAQRILAGWLKKTVEDGNLLDYGETLYSDLLNAALSVVKWDEIAQSYLPEE
ncbi:MAG: hypothetical protein JW829_20380 [Pirellulales bacterium]|nr:hypothetical protein [Pirellulales bacterium]